MNLDGVILDDLKEEWAQAGVTGGVPTNLNVIATIDPSDDIQTAINAASANGGGVILLNEGVYRIDETIFMGDGVVLRGADRDGVVIESSIRTDDPRDATIRYDEVDNAGLENLTLNSDVDGREPTPLDFNNDPFGEDHLHSTHVYIDRGSNDNWVTDVNVLNAGSNPVDLNGDHNTFANNLVSGAFNKGGGGNGYYAVNGDNNLIYNETVTGIRHFSIQVGAEHNVVTNSRFEVDVNFHNGDDGGNLVEGNVIDIPARHWWTGIDTGDAQFGHRPPGERNVLVNNDIHHAGTRDTVHHEPNVIYSFLDGFSLPEDTGLRIGSEERLYEGTPRADTVVMDEPDTPADPTPPEPDMPAESVGGQGIVVVDDFATTEQNKTIVVDVMGNDGGPEGGALTLSEVSYDGNTSIVSIQNGQIKVNPLRAATEDGIETIVYTVENVDGETATGTLMVQVGEDGNVDLTFDGVTTREKVEPYALFGDVRGDFKRGLDLDPGVYTLEVDGVGRDDVVLQSVDLTFELV